MESRPLRPYAGIAENANNIARKVFRFKKHLREVAKDLQGFYFKPVAGLVRGFYKIRSLMKRAEKNKSK